MGAATVRRVTLVVGTSAGGTGAHVRMLAAGLAERGLDVTVAGPSRTTAALKLTSTALELAPTALELTSAAVEFGDRPRPRDAQAIRTLRRLLTEPGTRPEVVHAHGMRAGALTAIALIGVRPRPGLVVTVHNAPPDGGGAARPVYLALERIVARKADVVLGVSSDLERRMRSAGARRVTRAVVPAPPANSDNSNKRGSAPGSWSGSASDTASGSAPDSASDSSSGSAPRNSPDNSSGSSSGSAPSSVPGSASGGAPNDGRPLILGIGRLAPQKDFATLIDAARAWQDRTPRPRLLIVGDGPLKADLAAWAAERNVDAELPGRRDDIPGLLDQAAVFVMPSRWEGQPLALQEALRAGVPIVASDAGGIKDLTGDAALLVRPGSGEELGQAVLSVLDNHVLAGRLREAARRRAAGLPTAEDAVTAVLEAYASALE